MGKKQSRKTQLAPRQSPPGGASPALDYATLPVASPARRSDWLSPSTLVPLFCALVVIGSLMYARGTATLKGNELSKNLSLFTAVNAATLTGFQQARNPDDYTAAGQVLTFILMLGGMLFSFIGGGLAVVRIAKMRFADWQVVAFTIITLFVAAVGGGAVLTSHDRTFFEGVFLATSAFGNCGLTLGMLPDTGSAQAILVVLPLAILGGLGLPVLMELLFRNRRQPLSSHSQTVIRMSAVVYLCLLVILILLQIKAGDFTAVVLDASQQAINSRSAGFPFQFASKLSQSVTFALVLVMIIGAGPGGAAGGLKVTTLAVLFTGTRDTLARRPAGRSFGLALMWTALYLTTLIMATIALLIVAPEVHLDRSLFLAASALGNVGLSHNPIDVSTAGLYVLSLAMMLGRIAPVMMLWYAVDTTPDCNIAIG